MATQGAAAPWLGTTDLKVWAQVAKKTSTYDVTHKNPHPQPKKIFLVLTRRLAAYFQPLNSFLLLWEPKLRSCKAVSVKSITTQQCTSADGPLSCAIVDIKGFVSHRQKF